MARNAFEAEVAKSAALLGLNYHKMAVPMKLGRRKGGGAFLQPLKEEPYDSFLVHQGRHIPIEMKSQQDYGRFDLSEVRDCQVKGLNRALEDGCDPWLLVNMRHLTVNSSRKRCNRTWGVPWRSWQGITRRLELDGRKSIPADWFDPLLIFFVVIPRIRVPGPDGKLHPVWDLSVLLKGL